MSFLSKIMKPIVRGQAPVSRRNMGGLEPRVPMPPRRKGGLAGLIQRVKGRLPERPISIGGVGGGVGITKSPLAQAAEKLRNSIQAVPVPPGQEGQLPIAPVNTAPIKIFGQTLSQEDSDRIRAGGSFRDLFKKMGPALTDEERAALPSAFGPTQRQAINPATGQPYTPTQEPELGSDLKRPLPGSLGPEVPIRPDLLPPKRGPIMSIGGPGGGITDDRAISPLERPNFIGRPPGRYDSIGMPLLDRNRPIGDDSRRRPQPGEPGATPIVDEVEATFGPPPVPQPAPQLSDQAIQQMFNKGNNPPPTPNALLADSADRDARREYSNQLRAGGDAFRAAFPDAPQRPRMGTMDRRMYIDPITGEQKTGSSTDISYRNSLKEYLDANPAAMESYQQNVLSIQKPESMIQGPRPVRGGPVIPPGGPIPIRPDILSPTIDEDLSQLTVPPVDNNPPPTPDVGLAQPAPVTDPVTPTVDPVTTAPTPSATTEQGTDPIQSMPAPVGALDPVLLGQKTTENLSDPLTRALYFGTQDQPGFYQQLQQAGANLIGQDVPLQQTAGLTPLELLARQQAVAGLGGFEPFFQQNKDLIDQAIGQSRRAEALRDPYFSRAERQMQIGLGDELRGIREARGITTGATDRFGRSLGRLGRQQIGATDEFGRRLSDVEARGEGAAGRFGESLGGIETGAIGATDAFGRSLGESEDLIRGTLGGYDQGMTQQFYNPFEDRVVQQTIDDVLEAGDKQDIAARAREISSGAFGGSRARLGAMERREALGEGLAKALGNIRQQGFSEAQRTGLSEFARQREAERAASRGLSGLAGTRFGAQSGLFDRLTSGAQQRLAAEQGVVDLLGRTGQQQLGAQQQLGSTLRGLTGDQFGAQQQLASNLMGYGAAGAGARQNLATGLLGIGQQRGAGASALGQQLAGFGQQIGGIGSSLDALRRGQRGELAGYGATGRGIAETGLSRIYQQQLGQQQRPLGVLGQIGSMLPGYQQTSTRIDSQYGLPTDPSAAGLGAAFSAYGALAPRQGQS